MPDFLGSMALAAGLGLLGFVEPCSVGSHLVFIKCLESSPARERTLQTGLFTLTRAVLMAALGVLAALIGSRFTGVQHGLWAALGGLYLLLGLIYLGGGAAWFIRGLNGLLPRFAAPSGSVGLGLLFGLNIPACAAPLLAVLLGTAAGRSASGAGATYGALTLLVFGLALSSPLVLAIFTQRGRRLLDAIARLAALMPRWTGAVLVVLGIWSISLAFS